MRRINHKFTLLGRRRRKNQPVVQQQQSSKINDSSSSTTTNSSTTLETAETPLLVMEEEEKPKRHRPVLTTPPIVPFWTSRTAFYIYTLFGLYVATKYSLFLYFAFYTILRFGYYDPLTRWMAYTMDDSEARSVVRYLRRVAQILRQEGTYMLVAGDYGRQVVTAYIVHACTAPGESYIQYLIRYKMNLLNRQWLDDLQHWKERRLGYEVVASRRNVFE